MDARLSYFSSHYYTFSLQRRVIILFQDSYQKNYKDKFEKEGPLLNSVEAFSVGFEDELRRPSPKTTNVEIKC